MKLSQVLADLETDTEEAVAKADAELSAKVLDEAGIELPTLDDIAKAREEGKVETRKVNAKPVTKEVPALKVKMVTMRKAIVGQLPILWQPTRTLFDDCEMLGIINARGVPDVMNNGWFGLVRQPSGNLILVKMHLQASQIDDYQQIVVT